MSVTAANEMIRAMALDVGLDDVDFSGLSLALRIDGSSILIEYLPGPEVFLVYGRVAEGIDARNAEQIRQINDFAHASAMMGGGSITLDGPTGDVWFAERMDLTGLTTEVFARRIGQVADAVAGYGSLIADAAEAGFGAPVEHNAIRV